MENPSIKKFKTFPGRPTEGIGFFQVSRSRKQKKYNKYQVIYTFCSGPSCDFFREGELIGDKREHSCIDEKTQKKYKYRVVVKSPPIEPKQQQQKKNIKEVEEEEDGKKEDKVVKEEITPEEEEEGKKNKDTASIKQIHPKLQHISNIFFIGDGVECVSEVLGGMSRDPPNEFLISEQKKYEKSLSIIDEQLSKAILSHYHTFVTGMTQIQELGTDLKQTMNVCREGKARLGASKQIAREGLELIAKHRRLRNLQKTKDLLVHMSSYKKCENTLKKFIFNNDLNSTVEYWTEYTNSLSKLRNMKALPFLRKQDKEQLKQIKFMIIKEMKECLLNQPLNETFNEEVYRLILKSITKMKRSKKKFFFGNIEKIFRNEVKRIGRKIPNQINSFEMSSKVIRLFCELLVKYQRIHLWHKKNDPYEPISDFRNKLWKDVKITIHKMVNSDHTNLKIEDFFQVFKSYQIFGELGKCFAPEFSLRDNSTSFQSIIESTSSKYFRHYHRNVVIPRLLLMINHECWIDLGNVAFKKLVNKNKEDNQSSSYKEMRNFVSKEVCEYFSNGDWEEFWNVIKEGKFKDIPSSFGLDENTNKIQKNEDGGTTTRRRKKEEENEGEDSGDDDDSDDSDDSDLDSDDELKRKERRRQKRVRSRPPMLVTNFTKELRKFQVIYLRSMEILQSIRHKIIFPSFKVLMYLYIYTIYSLFSSTQKGPNNEIIPRSILPEKDQRLSESLQSFFRKSKRLLDNSAPNSEQFFSPPTNPQNINVDQRCCMIESFNVIIRFHGSITDLLKKLLEKNNNGNNNNNDQSSLINGFNQELNKVITEIKLRFYGRLCKLYFPRDMNDYENIIMNCKYALKNTDPSDNVSAYVESFLRDFRIFKITIEGNNNKKNNNSSSSSSSSSSTEKNLNEDDNNKIREYSRLVIWKIAVETCFMKLLNGYAKVKKCDTRGRGQMKYDFVTFESELKRLVNIESIWPKNIIENVQGYITAFYFVTFDTLRDWLKEKKKIYSKDHLKALVNLKAKSSSSEIGLKLNKKLKDELFRAIMEQ